MPPETLTLAFDTSAAHCAAALLSGTRLVAAHSEPMEKGQAERLMPMLEELLAAAGAGWRDLALIGVGTGPGNFTGVRISVAAARGLALSLGIPAVGVSALEALAFGQPRPVVAALDARRGEVYVQLFDTAGAGAAVMTAADALPPWLPERPLLAGNAASRLAAAIPGASVAAETIPIAEATARLALARTGTAEPRPAPVHLRGADAVPPREAPPVILR